jgi:hypothetical protein
VDPAAAYDERMASEKTRAIVLKLVEFSETSYITTLFTRILELGFGEGGQAAEVGVRGRS